MRSLALLLALIAVVSATAEEFRYWTIAGGRRSDVRLQLVGQDDATVRLRREDNGKVVTLPIQRLSPADQDFLRANAPERSPAKQQAASSPAAEATSDWPQWRGPQRDGKSAATGLLTQWPDEGPELRWSIQGMGEGYSTPTLLDGKIYVLGTAGDEERLFCRDAETGEAIWQAPLGRKAGGGGYPGPRGSVTLEDGTAYAIGSDGTLVNVDLADGQVRWRKDLKRDFAGSVGNWDYAESPLIDGPRLICTPGGDRGTVVALDKSTGATIWSCDAGLAPGGGGGFAKAAYASPIVATLLGTKQYITFLNGGVMGVDAGSGQPLWQYTAPANGTANCSTPVIQGNAVFAASAYGTGGGKATIRRAGRDWNVQEDFFVKKFENHHGGFVLVDNHLYGTNNSVLMCVDWQSGRIKWQDRCVGKGSVTYADGLLYVRGERGDVALVAAQADAYDERGRFSQPQRSDKNAWPHPVVAGGRLYLRDWDRLLCFEIQSKP